MGADFELSEEQSKALSAIKQYILDDETQSFFILNGYAGTGKTTITKIIGDFVEKKEGLVLNQYAPTGRAAYILGQKTDKDAVTIHKGIYNLNVLDELPVSKDKKGNVTYKFRFRLNPPDTRQRIVYIIDEASMISNKYSEHDFFIFGTGFLLNDLVNVTGSLNSQHINKVIIIGDDAQLPPVNENSSPALSPEYLKNTYSLKVHSASLKEVFRQKSSSSILKASIDIRKSIGDLRHFLLDVEKYEGINVIEYKEVANEYSKLNPNQSLNACVAISYTNKASARLNQEIRQKYYNDISKPNKNDILIIQNNNYNYGVELFNGTFVKVLKVSNLAESKMNLPSYTKDGKPCKVNYVFREVEIEVPNKNKLVKVTCLILESFLNNEARDLSYEESIGLYLYFKFRHPDLKPGTEAFKNALKNDPYFNVLKVKYGYALTCHKAQGGEWENVLVNMDVNIGKSSDTYKRWLYTAITRSSENLTLFNYAPPNSFNLFDKLLLAEKVIAESAIPVAPSLEQLTFVLPSNYIDTAKDLQIDITKTHILEKYKQLLALSVNNDFKINYYMEKPYQDHYTLEFKGMQIPILLIYNGKNIYNAAKLKNANLLGTSPVYAEILEILNAPLQIIFVEGATDYTEIQEQNSSDIFSNESVLKERYANLKTVFDDYQIHQIILFNELSSELVEYRVEIVKVVCFQYSNRYSFERGNEKGTIDFYFDKNQVFTSTLVVENSFNSQRLYDDLRKVINGVIQLV